MTRDTNANINPKSKPNSNLNPNRSPVPTSEVVSVDCLCWYISLTNWYVSIL